MGAVSAQDRKLDDLLFETGAVEDLARVGTVQEQSVLSAALTIRSRPISRGGHVRPSAVEKEKRFPQS